MIGAIGSGGGMNAMSQASMQRKMFEKVDSNGDGGIDKSELQAMFDEVGGENGTTPSAEEVFEQFDTDGDGLLSEEENAAAMEANRPAGPPPGPPPGGGSMFEDADSDDSGGIDLSELQTFFNTINEQTGNTSDVDAEELFTQFDVDEDGELSEDEAAQLDSYMRESMGALSMGDEEDEEESTTSTATAEGIAAYTANSGDLASTLLSLLSDDESEESYKSISLFG